MIKLLDCAIEAARALPPERQDELARRLIAMVQAGGQSQQQAAPPNAGDGRVRRTTA